VGLAQKNPPWLKPLLLAISAVAPGLRLKPSWFVHGKATAPQLTRIPERQHAVETAPHRLGPTPIRFLASMGDLIDDAVPVAERLQTPVAVFSAGRDAFVTPEQIENFFAHIRSTDKTHFHYAESYHQLMFDLDAPEVLADAATWIVKQLNG
jgi:alpha-beta hydrolase superfamily lysophospholipase